MSEDVVEDAEEGEDTVPVVSDPEHVHDPLLHDDELSLLLRPLPTLFPPVFATPGSIRPPPSQIPSREKSGDVWFDRL